MTNYTFNTLNDNDFELLALDLLQYELNVRFQDFTTGKDSGIDLRYATIENENDIIVQVKHWLKSGYRKLFNHLKKSELLKANPFAFKLLYGF